MRTGAQILMTLGIVLIYQEAKSTAREVEIEDAISPDLWSVLNTKSTRHGSRPKLPTASSTLAEQYARRSSKTIRFTMAEAE